MYSVSALSTEYLLIPVAATEQGITVNPTTQSVDVAATVQGAEPLSGDWKSAAWESDTTDADSPVYSARLLIGPAGVLTLTAGVYELWLRVTDNPEVVVRRAQSLWVF